MEKTDFIKKVKNQLQDKTGATSFLELCGTSELLISGCIGIKEYTADEITVDTLRGVIKISGQGLHLSVYRGDIMSVEGTVSVIDLGGTQ